MKTTRTPPVAGGQGRTAGETTDAGFIVALCLAIGGILVGALLIVGTLH